ncbi:MAG: HAD family hydrolase [Bacilli bacterium]|nr:HAD family hydrolase [Bacilli bacterium]
MYKHLIFDLDGTIVDTLPGITEAVNLALKHFRKSWRWKKKDVYNFVGYGTPYLINCAFKGLPLDLDTVLDYYLPTQAITHQRKDVKIFHGLLKTLNKLKARGYTLYIATNKPVEVGPSVIARLYGENYFKDAVYQTRTMPKKPDPYVINEIIRRNQLDRNECLYIGDSEVDLKAAKNAKIASALVKYGYGQYGKFSEDDAIFKIKHPKELLKHLK